MTTFRARVRIESEWGRPASGLQVWGFFSFARPLRYPERMPWRLPGRSLLLLWSVVIVGVTTVPWSDFQGHAHWSSVCWIPFTDTLRSPGFLFNALANVLLVVGG